MATTTKNRRDQKTRLRISTITVELLKPPKHPIRVGIFIDGGRVYKLPPIATDLPLRWNVDLPIDVVPQSQVTIQIKEVHLLRLRQGDSGSCKLSDHPDWLSYEPTGAQKEIVQQAGTFTVSVKFSPPLGIKDTQLIAERAINATDNVPSSILRKLGQARAAVETIVSLLEHVEEVHPMAKVALSTLTKAFKFLEEEEKYDESIRDLALGMADMLSFAEVVNQHAKVVKLKDTVAQMMFMVEDASRYILEFQSSSAIGKTVVALVSSERRDKIDGYIKQFDTLRKAFDRGVTVQILDVSSQVLRVVSATEDKLLGEQDRLLLNELPRAHSAGYDPSGGCMEGTRTKILQDIIEWTTQHTGSAFLWISGPAGSGKSSIATSVATELQKRNILGATFFCSREKPELRDPTLILPTIVARLAIVFPAFGKAVAEQLRRDPQIGESAMQFQYEGLFSLPLKEKPFASRPDPLIIIIDALDECGTPETRTVLLKYLLKISSLTNWLKVAATSRPEPEITSILGDSPYCTPFPLPLNDTATYNDILFFTQTRMVEITRARNLKPSDWPGEVRTKRLAELAGGLFIWAQTAYRFIASGFVPEERLDQVLSNASTAGIHSKLDALYTTALSTVFQESDSDNLEIFRLVVGTIVTLLTPLPIQDIFTLLGGRISEIGIQSVVNSLRSVLYEDEQNDLAIRVYHVSFADFITDRSRSPQFFVDLCQHHTALATASLKTMQGRLKFNICDVESSDLFNDQIPDLGKRVKNAIPIPLKYSCRHWMAHLYNSAKDEPLVEALKRFLTQETVLFWIEALSLLGEIPAALHGLPLVVSWFQDLKNAESLFITDIHRFILGFREPITRSAPHLYISALPFAPTESLISKRFLSSFPNTVVLDDRESFWSPCLQTLEGHSDRIAYVSWSPDGQRLASGSYDTSICVWDSTTGAMMQRLRGHSSTVSSVSFSPNSRLIASCSWDKTIQVWDVETGVPIFPPLIGHGASIFRVIFSPDGRYLGSCSRDKTIRIWDVITGKSAMDPFTGHSDLIYTIAYSPDGMRLVSCSDDQTVRVWDVKTGYTVLGPLTIHHDKIYALDYSPDGQRILSGSRDSSILIWDSTTGAISLGPLQVGDTVLFAKFSPDGRLILSTSLDSKIRIWDAASGTELFNQEHSGSITSASFSPDGQHLLTGSSDRTVRIWELNSLCPSVSSVSDSWHTDIVYSVAVSSDGKYIASGSWDRTVRVWHADTGISACAPLQGHDGAVQAVTFSPDSQLILSASWDNTLRLWAVATWGGTMEPFSGHIGAITCVAFSPDGRIIISGSRDRTIRLWDPATSREICEPLQGHQGPVIALDVSNDGRLIGSGSEDTTLKIWDFVSRQKLFDLPHGTGNVWSIAFSPDSEYIASYSNNNGYVRLWDVQTQVVLWKSSLPPSTGPSCCIFSRNGRHLFFSPISMIFVLDTTTGSTHCAPLRGHDTFIHSLAISPNGKHLISGSDDRTIRAWDIELAVEENRQELLPDAQNLFGPVGDDGWVRLQTAEPLLWIPTEYRAGLWKRALYSIPPTAQNHPRTLDCSRFLHGSDWTKVRGI